MIQWIIVLGVATGMRTMTAMAALCWFMWFALLPVTGWTFWTANIITVTVFTVFALGEYYGDTLPSTPSRKNWVGWIARLTFGGLVGAIVSASYAEPVAGGVLLALIGVVIGTLGGYRLRMYFAKLVGQDFPVAVSESALAIVLSVTALWFIHADIARQLAGHVLEMHQ